jgi:hypothetical protein
MTRRYEIVKNARGFVHEDKLPEDFTDEDYNEWFKMSYILAIIGCRVGPPVRKLETIQDEKKPEMNDILIENRIMKKALKRIEKWFGEIPAPYVYQTNGRAEFMRSVARDALDQVG